MSEPLRVLILEDRHEDAELMLHELRQAGFEPDWRRVEREEEFVAELKSRPDIILADYTLPEYTAVSALAALKASGLDIPLIVVTGTLGDETAVECMRLGATDYLLKDRLARLGRSVVHALEDMRARAEKRRIREEKRWAEAAILDSEVRHRTLVDALDDAINVKDLHGRYVTVNAEFLRRVRKTREEVVGRTAFDLYPAEWAEQIQRAEQGVLASGEAVDLTAWAGGKDARIYHLRKLPLRNGEGAIVGLVTASRDVTESRRAEDALRQSEEKIRNVFEASPDAIIVTDTRGRMVDCNEAALRLFGACSKEQLIGMRALSLVAAADRSTVTGCLGDIPTQGSMREVGLTLQRLDGTSFPAEVSASVMRDHAGKPVGIVTVSRDVTEQRRSEDAIRRGAEALRRAMVGTIQAMAAAAEMRDPYTAGHQRQTAKLATEIARKMVLPEDTVEAIGLAGEIHDIGKVGVPAEILSKPGRLTPTELEMTRGHALAGYDILKGIEFPWPIAQMVAQHHERLDGSGYPVGLGAGEILLGARILAVADVVEAMASHRPYRPARGLEEALAEIERGRGRLYDPDAVDACLDLCRRDGFSLT